MSARMLKILQTIEILARNNEFIAILIIAGMGMGLLLLAVKIYGR